MKYVLHLKHWQLFLITFALPFTFYIGFFISMFTSMISQTGRPEPVFDFSPVMIIGITLFGVSIVASFITMLGWSFQVATGLYKKLPAGHTMKINRYYFAFFYPILYFILFASFVGIFFIVIVKTGAIDTSPTVSAKFFGWFFLIIPFHFLAVACHFYTLYFIAKSLKSVELQRNPVLGEYVAEFVLTWFFMIGVFFIQPRINQIFAEETNTAH